MDNNGPRGGNSGNFAGQQRVNEQIRIAQVRVIADDGEQLGVMSSQDALAKARAAGLDLVEVAPQAKPPVCRIMDYGKYKYQQKKRVAKQQTNKTQIKELRLRPKTGVADVQVKVNKAKEYARENWKRAQGASKVGGATEAASAMAKEAGNKMVGNTMANIAAQDTARKARVDDQHRQAEANFAQMDIQRENQRAANITNAAQNASNAIMSMEGAFGSNKADLTGSGNMSKVFADRNAAQAVQNMRTTAKADHAKILQTDGDKLPWTGGMWV